MNNNFYTQENLNYLKKRSTTFLILELASLVLFVALFVVFILCATRGNKSLILLLGGLSLAIVVSALILFSSLCSNYKIKLRHFLQIYKDKGDEKVVTYLRKNEHYISLQDKSTVYELYFMTDSGERRYYLVTLFDFNFEQNKEYKITLVSGFIKEVEC